MKIAIACPSYGRPDRLETPNVLPDIRVFVDSTETQKYQERNPNAKLEICPDGIQGNICRVRNYILDSLLPMYDAVLIVDDDFQGLFIWEGKKSNKIEGKEFYCFVEKYSLVAKELKVGMWGVNVNTDAQCYRERTPFSFLSYVGSPFGVFLHGCSLRYDERFSLKEDYDMTLQQIKMYRKILRVNKAYYSVRQVEQRGGCSTYRSVQNEKNQLKLLQKKWGSEIVKTSDRSHIAKTRKHDKVIQINPILHVPISGV